MPPSLPPTIDAHTPVDTDRIVGRSALLGELRDLLRVKHYSIRTEQAYLAWAKRFILFHDKRHPNEMGGPEIAAFLTDLAVQRHVAASTQNQALNALVFLYKQLLRREDLQLGNVTPAKRPRRLPTVFDRSEVERVLSHMEGVYHLIALLLYGAGLRTLEALRLRIQDIEFERAQIVVRDGKGEKDRATLLPPGVVRPIREQMAVAQARHVIARIWPPGWARSTYPMLWSASTRTRHANGDGNACFRPAPRRLMSGRTRYGAITSANPRSSEPSRRR